jgi:putative ABC transport system permease protein
MSIWSRIANVFRPRNLARDIDEELASHLAEAVEQGRDPDEVREAFGSPLRHRENSLDIRLLPWLDSLRADAIFGWRQIRKSKVTSAAAILSLALAIGACTSAFRLVDALLFRPLPVTHPERLYAVAFQGVGMDRRTMVYDSSSYPMFRRMRDAVKDQAESIAVSYAERSDLTYASDQDMERAYRQYVSEWMFGTLGIQQASGRFFTPGEHDPAARSYAVLSYDYWTRRFARDPKIMGRTFRMANTVYRVIGVSEKSFTGTETGTVTDIFLPMSAKDPDILASYNNFWLRTLVQLRPGVEPQPIHDHLNIVFRAIQIERAKTFVAITKQALDRHFKEQMLLEPAAAGRSNLQRQYRPAMAVLSVLVALVLLIACANVANLMTARAAARAREMALRVSIGAGPWRLVQLVIVESAWIAILASAIGALVAWWSAPVVVRMIDLPDSPAQLFLPADWRVLGFALLLALAVTILFGLMPAFRASAIQPVNALKGGEDPHSRNRLMHAMIAAQVAFCFVVHFVAGLFISSFDRLTSQATGFSSDRVVNLETLAQTPQSPVYWDQVADRLRTLPGVEKVSLSGWPMMSGESRVGLISVNGGRPSEIFSDFLLVSPGWMDVLRIPLLAGRDFRPEDANPSVAIVNQSFAKQYFDGNNPVGKWFEKVDGNGARTRLQIVGLVGDARSRDLHLPARPTVHIPFRSIDTTAALRPSARGTFVVRTSAENPLALASVLRRAVFEARPGFHVSNIRTQNEINRQYTIRERLLAVLALFFAVVALLLAAVGLYGVLDYSVWQRRREIGIRMAIGAPASDIARRVTVDVLMMVLAGAATGVVLGEAATRYIEALFFDVKPTDLHLLVLPLGTILCAAMLSALPAMIRAVRIDPVALLRSE